MVADSMLSFVPYTRDFLAKSWEWLNDAETKALTLTPDFTKEQQEMFYASLPSRMDYLIWGIALYERPVGVCGLKHLTKVDAEYWGYIGEKQLWGRGLGRQIIEHCEDMARARGLESVYLHVAVGNARAKRLYEKCGFVEVGLLQNVKVIMRKCL